MSTIGIILDHESSGGYSQHPWYAARENYSNAITLCGGHPIFLPYSIESIEHYANLIDGLIIIGGDFDISPEMYSLKNEGSRNLKNNRSHFELQMFKTIFSKNKPILGICNGEQLINVALGGTLVQHIPDAYGTNHEQKIPHTETFHDIIISTESMLFSIVKTNQFSVNSSHHQAVMDLGENMIVSAKAEDGVIEAIEHTKHPFCIGVEWHPEYLCTSYDKEIFQAFVNATRKTL